MELHSNLQVSTVHLRPSTLKMLEEDSISGLVSFRKDDYGHFVVVDIEDVCFGELPSELAYLLAIAKAHDCYYLEFDRDAEPSPDLKTFGEDSDCDCL